eukprot:scaffold1913_cov257-Pinguiococcus_pyrenoidosus.AAC.31
MAGVSRGGPPHVLWMKRQKKPIDVLTTLPIAVLRCARMRCASDARENPASDGLRIGLDPGGPMSARTGRRRPMEEAMTSWSTNPGYEYPIRLRT